MKFLLWYVHDQASVRRREPPGWSLFTCKNRRRYSRERASPNLGGDSIQYSFHSLEVNRVPLAKSIVFSSYGIQFSSTRPAPRTSLTSCSSSLCAREYDSSSMRVSRSVSRSILRSTLRGGPGEPMSNFRRLVLGCIDSYDSEQRRILQHFSRSTRFAFFCTAPISNFADFSQIFSRKFPDFLGFLQNFAEFLRNFSKNQQIFDANLQNFRY